MIVLINMNQYFNDCNTNSLSIINNIKGNPNKLNTIINTTMINILLNINTTANKQSMNNLFRSIQINDKIINKLNINEYTNNINTINK